MPRKPGSPVPSKYVYMIATLVASAIILVSDAHPWGLYLGACVGYTILVFGLHLRQRSRLRESARSLLTAKVLLTHANFLAIVVAWVWLLIVLAPRLPYVFRMEDTDRPYLGLAFFGILGIMLLELVEQRYLFPKVDPAGSQAQLAAGRQAKTPAPK